MKIQFIARNLKDIILEFERCREGVKKAAGASLKIEGYRLMKELKRNLETGQIAGYRMAPLRRISALMGRPKDRSPYYKFLKLVKYRSFYEGKGPGIEVGFLGLINRKHARALSGSYQRILTGMQEGSQIPVKEDLRKGLLEVGARLRKRHSSDAGYFFLRKATTSFNLPARPVISPFWDAQKAETERNVISNFYRKMKGERNGSQADR